MKPFRVGDIVMRCGTFGYEGPCVIATIDKKFPFHHTVIDVCKPWFNGIELAGDLALVQNTPVVAGLKKIWTPEAINLALKLYR